jgi:hypothetical protein
VCGALRELATREGSQRDQEVGVAVRHVFGLEAVGVLLGNEARIELTAHKPGVRQQRRLEGDVAADTTDHEPVERFAHLGNGLGAVFAVHDELGNHRVVEHGDFAAIDHAGVHPHTTEVAVGIRCALQRLFSC